MLKITSEQNPTFKMLQSLLKAKGVKKENKALVFGKKLVQEFKNSFSSKTTVQGSNHKKVQNYNFKTIHHKEDSKVDILLTKKLFKELSPMNLNEEFLLVNTSKLKISNFSRAFEVFLPVGDPKNLGALIRTCLAFDVEKITLLEEAAHPFLPETIKASSGAVFKAPLFKGPSLQKLDFQKNKIWTLDKSGQDLATWKHKSSLSDLKFLVGEEGGHLSKQALKKSLSIKINPKVESLNVNSALTCLLFKLQCNDEYSN